MTLAFHPQPLAARETGAGTPVVLLHGSFSDARQWRSLSDWLGGRHHVVAVDLPGYGNSRNVSADSLEEMVEHLRPFIVRHSPVHVVGHSLGGAVALKAACHFPGHVRSLTLIEPPVIGALSPRSDMASRGLVAAVLRSKIALAEGDAWDGTRQVIDYWNGAGAWDRTSFRLRQALAEQIGRAHRDYAALTSDRASRDDLASVVCPVLSLRGTHSPAITARVRDEVIRALPFARHEEIEGAGHMLPLTDPHLVDPMIGRFLARVDRGWQDVAGSTRLAA